MCSICLIGIPEGEEREREVEEMFEVIMAENSPKLMTDTKPQIQEAQRTPSRLEGEKTTLTLKEHV